MVTRLCWEFFVLAKPSHRFAYISWRSIVTVLHTCVSIMLKCIRTRYRMEPISEGYQSTLIDMLKHSVWLPEQGFQFKYLGVYSISQAFNMGSAYYCQMIFEKISRRQQNYDELAMHAALRLLPLVLY